MNRRLVGLCNMVIILVCSVFYFQAFAARPFVTDDAGTVAQGEFELETGYDFWKNAGAAGIAIKHGITSQMDVGFGFGYNILPEEERQFEGAEIGLKFGLIPELFALTANGNFGDKAFGVNAILSKGIGSVSFDANIGMNAITDTKEADLTYAFCCHYDISKFCIGGEISGTEEELSLWQIGFIYEAFDWAAIDAGINGDFEDDTNFSATVGLTFTIPAAVNAKQKGE